ncbi:MAG: hypothetical protein KC486_30310, partial [Myxococcales bacterium]|nr:hypothetical protein [Myxococcales bacterium]
FQRLRRIKQTGLLSLVFPGATHTRFEHSVGALHCADAMLEAMVLNAEAAPSATRRLEDAAPGDAVNLAAIDPQLRAELFRVARLAALVHDLGHGPLSHTFDGFAPRRGRIADILDEDELLSGLRPLRAALLGARAPAAEDEPAAHEALSCLLFAWIWRGVLGEQGGLEVRVAAVILGGPAIACLRRDPLRPWLPLLHDLVAAAPADADRMDYVERDALACGVAYGRFDRGRLLKSLLCYRDLGDPEGPPELRLGWRRSGLRALENFIQARFQLYVQVYHHKANEAVNLMLRRIAALAAGRSDGLFSACDDLEGLAAIYDELSDEAFLAGLRGRDPATRWGATIEGLAEAVARRKLWRRIHEDEGEGAGRFAATYAAIAAARGGREDVAIVETPLRPTGDLRRAGGLLGRGRDGCYRVQCARSWTEVSPLLRTLEVAERSLARIFLCPLPERGESIDAFGARVAADAADLRRLCGDDDADDDD